jgi:hypothetical protein
VPIHADEDTAAGPGYPGQAPAASQPGGDRSRHAGATRHAGALWGEDTPRHAGAPSGPEELRGAAELRATELRVRQVRVVREVKVRTLRVDSRSAATPQPPVSTRSRTLVQSQAQARTGLARAETASQPGALRLTRRGRRVVAGFAILVVLAAVAAIWIGTASSVQASSGHAASGSPYQGMTQIVVRPGQTLWSVAAAAEPSGDSWDVVQQIINVNAMNGPEIRAGQLLWVPKT